MKAGTLLDRPLEPEWLDIALSAANESASPAEARQRIDLWLRDVRLGDEARGKTVTALARVWVEPPERVREALVWGRESFAEEPNLAGVHLLALMAVYPFFGDVCVAVGRMLALDEHVGTPEVRARMRASWGDRRAVHNAVQRAVKTLRAFGVISGEPGTSDSTRGVRLTIPPTAARWAAHAVILSRGAESIDERDITSAPELFWLEPPTGDPNGYPFIERHREGGGRVVLATR